MLYIGIDPGKNGAVGIIDEKYEKYYVYDMPKNLGRELFLILNPYRHLKLNITVESSKPMRGKGVSTFLINYGIILGVLQSLNYPYKEVYPITWKKEFNLLKNNLEVNLGTKSQLEHVRKLKSVELAQQIFPNIKYYTERNRMLDGRAEALLLAEYGKRMSNKENQNEGHRKRRKKKRRIGNRNSV